ncbi:elongation of very long chain fatty acids protein 7 [Nephila pilipes]|uniref:Elongation of very long chain fatty acids protein n=1 Tax=Nephila pilipes TaxID=299642 RepID=A0A8X6NXV8_NEPPI|nr:elongation of very long chain fatty acids protein 7 [Nephila pilipes]
MPWFCRIFHIEARKKHSFFIENNSKSELGDNNRNIFNMVLHAVYDFFFNYDIENKTVIKHPIVPFSIVAFYLLFVIWIGPALMKNRKPFTLRKTLIAYNFLQSVANTIVAYQIFYNITEHWEDRCNVKTSPRLPSLLKKSMKMIWELYLLKFVDLLDTVFFVLRKKQNQVTFLHLFHHSGLCLFGTWGLRNMKLVIGFYIAVGFGINTIVHVIMYFYYGLAACGPSIRKYLWWKKYLTLIQILQIVFIVTYMGVGFLTGCEEFEMIFPTYQRE